MQVLLERENGVLKININGKLYEPLSFKTFRPSERNISEFANAGIKLFSIMVSGLNCAYDVPYSLFGETWFGKGRYNFDAVDRQIELFMNNSPGCYYAIMIHLDTRDWWHETHRDYPCSFLYLSQVVADPEWREATTDYMKAMMEHIEEKYGEYVYGYFMLCGRGTEWFSRNDYQAANPIKERYYKEYTGNPDAVIPSKEELELPKEVGFYDNPEVKLYQRAHAELIADTILFFAKEAQKVLKHKKLLGLYFGYLMEFKNWIQDAGHLAYEKVYFSDDIDMISSPASYAFREPDSTSAFMVTHKSLDDNNKLYFYEYDQRTYLSQDFALSGGGYYCKNDTEAVDLMRRDFMLCASNNAALWWFDMFEGWYSSEQMMKGVADIVNFTKRISEVERKSVAEVVLIGFPEALYGANKKNDLHDSLLYSQRDGYMRMGAPFDIYSAGDMEKINLEQYKLVVFLNAFEIDPVHEWTINQMKAMGKTILWIYAPEYLNGGVEQMERTIDMEIECLEAKPTCSKCGRILPAPYFAVSDQRAVSLVDYDNGKTAVAYKVCENYTSVYSAIGLLDEKIIKQICGIAGVHIYCETAPVYVNSYLTGVYSFEDVVLHVQKDGIYEEVFSGEKYEAKEGKLFIPAGKYASKLLVCI